MMVSKFWSIGLKYFNPFSGILSNYQKSCMLECFELGKWFWVPSGTSLSNTLAFFRELDTLAFLQELQEQY
jgi:hypothetical protein